jgi:hypothetical protein
LKIKGWIWENSPLWFKNITVFSLVRKTLESKSQEPRAAFKMENNNRAHYFDFLNVIKLSF